MYSRIDFPKKWEIVYFITTRCNNFCQHCWSKNNFLGSDVPLEQHEKFISKLNFDNVTEFKLSGGEVTLYDNLSELITLCRKYMPDSVNLTIFSNGRIFFNTDGTILSKKEIFDKLEQLFNDNKVNLHISIDEYHLMSFSKSHQMDFKKAGEQYCKLINFLIDYTRSHSKVQVKLKLHCNKGRLNWHRVNLYAKISNYIWDNFIIKTEGLIKSGNAKNMEDAEEIRENNCWSAFMMPGAEFGLAKTSEKSDVYFKENNIVYLNPSTNGKGALILGWWNIINKNLLGGDIYEFAEFIK